MLTTIGQRAIVCRLKRSRTESETRRIGTEPEENRKPRSYSTNGGEIRRLRRECVWKQPELADKAGCSARLVSAAENGGPVGPDALNAFATAFTLKLGRHVGVETLIDGGHVRPPSAPPAQEAAADADDDPLATSAEALFEALAGVTSTPLNGALFSNGDGWLTDSEKQQWVIRRVRDARHEVRLICYSMIFWKETLDRDLTDFLKRGGRLRILMLDPASRGFLEKSAVEAFRRAPDIAERPLDERIKAWRDYAKGLRAKHRHDINSSVGSLHLLREQSNGGDVRCRMYSDTPNLYGFMVDNRSLYVSSYFFEPVTRGFSNPARTIDRDREPHLFDAFAAIYRNWFDVKFATGRDPEASAG